MAKKNEAPLLIEDARILFRNFKGEAKQYNAEGDRNFCVLLDPAVVDDMASDGWNVKYLKAREEGDEPQPYLEVKVGYKVRPPRAVLIGETSGNRTDLHEGLIALADDVNIVKADVMIRPYNWEVNGKSGVKAYLQTMYLTIEEDYLELKYNQTPGMDDSTPPWEEE